MNHNKLFLIVVALLLVSIGTVMVKAFQINNLRADLGIRNIDLKKKNKQIELQQDSLRKARLQIASQDSVWSHHLKEQYDLLVIERKKVNYYKGKYEGIKNSPTPRWTNAELDSLLSAITGHH